MTFFQKFVSLLKVVIYIRLLPSQYMHLKNTFNTYNFCEKHTVHFMGLQEVFMFKNIFIVVII